MRNLVNFFVKLENHSPEITFQDTGVKPSVWLKIAKVHVADYGSCTCWVRSRENRILPTDNEDTGKDSVTASSRAQLDLKSAWSMSQFFLWLHTCRPCVPLSFYTSIPISGLLNAFFNITDCLFFNARFFH